MLVSSSVRLTCASARHAKIFRSSFGFVLKGCVVLSPNLNSGTLRRIGQSLSSRSSRKSFSHDVVEDFERDDSKYMYKKLTRKENINRLMECIGCSQSSAQLILNEQPKMKYTSSAEISRIVTFLNEKGISTEVICENPKLLSLKTEEVEEIRVIFADLGVSSNLAGPLLKIPYLKLKATAYWAKQIVMPSGKTKISILCHKLKCDPAEIMLAASVHKFLTTVPFHRMCTIFDILLAEGVPSSKILQDLWVVRYRVEKVQDRVERAREGGIEQFKTWMIRCTEPILLNTIRIQAEKRALLGPHNDSTVDYISSRLNMSRDEAQMILWRQPQLKGVGAAKLCNTFDFLLGKDGKDPGKISSDGGNDIRANFDRHQIWSSSRILCHSLETMKARLARLRELGCEPESPAVLYKSKKKFEEFVKKLEEKKELEEKSRDVAELDATVKETSEAKQTDVSR